MLSKSIEQLKQPGSHLEEAEEELNGDHSMQEERAPASGASIRAESSSAGEDDRIGQQAGAVKVKEEPPDSDEDTQTQQMESGEQAAFVQQVIGKDLAPGFVIKVIIWTSHAFFRLWQAVVFWFTSKSWFTIQRI